MENKLENTKDEVKDKNSNTINNSEDNKGSENSDIKTANDENTEDEDRKGENKPSPREDLTSKINKELAKRSKNIEREKELKKLFLLREEKQIRRKKTELKVVLFGSIVTLSLLTYFASDYFIKNSSDHSYKLMYLFNRGNLDKDKIDSDNDYVTFMTLNKQNTNSSKGIKRTSITRPVEANTTLNNVTLDDIPPDSIPSDDPPLDDVPLDNNNILKEVQKSMFNNILLDGKEEFDINTTSALINNLLNIDTDLLEGHENYEELELALYKYLYGLYELNYLLMNRENIEYSEYRERYLNKVDVLMSRQSDILRIINE